MAKKKRANTNLGILANGIQRFLKEAAAAPPWLEKRKTGAWPEFDLPGLRQLTETLVAEREKAEEQVGGKYKERRNAIEQVVVKRRQRLKAYAKGDRKAIPKEKDKFIIAGRVIDKASGVGLPNIKVSAFDLDRKYDDRLGGTRTDALGYFRIDYAVENFKDLGDKIKETYIEVLGDDGEVLFTSTKSFILKAGRSEYVKAKVNGGKVPISLEQGRKIDESINKRQKELERRERILARGGARAVKKTGR